MLTKEQQDLQVRLWYFPQLQTDLNTGYIPVFKCIVRILFPPPITTFNLSDPSVWRDHQKWSQYFSGVSSVFGSVHVKVKEEEYSRNSRPKLLKEIQETKKHISLLQGNVQHRKVFVENVKIHHSANARPSNNYQVLIGHFHRLWPNLRPT